MKKVKHLLTVSLLTVGLTACGSDVIAADDIKKMSAVEIATLFCNAMKESDVEQLKVLVTDPEIWQRKFEHRFSSEDQLKRIKLKAEKYDCTIVETKERPKYTKFQFKNFRKVIVKKENGINVLSL
ncbi:MAG: hypothetical protein ACPGR2_13655 [Psychrobium sp.]